MLEKRYRSSTERIPLLINASKPSCEELGGMNDDFDPYCHREVANPTNNMETFVHLLKGCIGTGILAMPEAFKQAGMTTAIVSTFIIGFLCTYCLHILVRTQYCLCKRLRVGLLTYPESMRVACEVGPCWMKRFAPIASFAVIAFIILFQIGSCCAYLIFVAINVKAVGDMYTQEPLSLTYYMLMFFIPFLLIMCVKDLKYLAPFSLFATIITFATFGVACYYIFQDLPPYYLYPHFASMQGFALYFGTALFALQSIGVVIALENNMKTPQYFLGWRGLLSVGMTIITSTYVFMGMMGYWKYGDCIMSSITLNFPASEILAQLIRILYSIAIYISYGLQGIIPVQLIWDSYLEKNVDCNWKTFWDYALRFSIVFLTYVFSLTVPFLGLVISLSGSFCLSALGIIFPALMEIAALWPNCLGRGNWILLKDLVIILLGFVGLGVGSYTCLNEMARQMNM